MPSIDQWSSEPLWSQLAAILRQQIADGTLAPGDPLPSEQALQDEHGVSRGTVRHALRVLKDEGLVVTFAGRGSFVPPGRAGIPD